MILNDLLSLTVKQLASLQENGLYLLRVLFEIGNFCFFYLWLPVYKLIVIPICHNLL